MSIESKIEDLTRAIVGLTSALNYSNERSYAHISVMNDPQLEIKEEKVNSETKKAPKSKLQKVKSEAAFEEKDRNYISTVDLMALARKKISEGHDIQIIKAKTTSFGANSISTLSPEDRDNFEKFLNSLAVPEVEIVD